MSVCAAPTCSHQSFDGSSYYVDTNTCKYTILLPPLKYSSMFTLEMHA